MSEARMMTEGELALVVAAFKAAGWIVTQTYHLGGDGGGHGCEVKRPGPTGKGSYMDVDFVSEANRLLGTEIPEDPDAGAKLGEPYLDRVRRKGELHIPKPL